MPSSLLCGLNIFWAWHVYDGLNFVWVWGQTLITPDVAHVCDTIEFVFNFFLLSFSSHSQQQVSSAHTALSWDLFALLSVVPVP